MSADDVLAVVVGEKEERQLILACRWVKMAAGCQSAGSSSQIEGFSRSLTVLIFCIDFLCLQQRQLMKS